MDTPMQVNGSRDPFPIPFRKFFNPWLGLSVNMSTIAKVFTIQDVIDVSIMKTVVNVIFFLRTVQYYYRVFTTPSWAM